MTLRRQRVRDPLHDLIVFGSDQFEATLWRVIQTLPFQRLRRIKQLGFADLVFPGATHTRFAHSIGVFHTARQLMQVIQRHVDGSSSAMQFRDHHARVALAAALVHDIGHGMFSHAFQEVGSRLGLHMARHEDVSEQIVQNSEVTAVFQEMGSGFPSDVAEVIKRGAPANLYESVVSSQFDADRLDYIQRDRLMTGVESSGIDPTWLLANLEIGCVRADAAPGAGDVETLIVGPKAFRAAENYVLSLFQLYPNVYYHKATKAAEKVFAELMVTVLRMIRDGHYNKTGLPARHPYCLFAENPCQLDHALKLDDTVFLGTLPLMIEAEDETIARYAKQLWYRHLPKCIDVQQHFEDKIPPVQDGDCRVRDERRAEIRSCTARVISSFKNWTESLPNSVRRNLIDEASRTPYKKFENTQSPLNQIFIRSGNHYIDMARLSPVVASAETFEVCRVYVADDDAESKLRQLLNDR